MNRVVFGIAAASCCMIADAQIGDMIRERDRHIATVRRYWEWMAYWSIDGIDFPGAKYRPGFQERVLSIHALEGWADPYFAFCSVGLGVCQAYFTLEDGAVCRANSIRLRPRESREAALLRFAAQDFRGDSDIATLNYQIFPPPRPTVSLEGKTANRILVVRDIEFAVVDSDMKLHPLGVPEATRGRYRNPILEKNVAAEPRGPCKVLVPHSDKFSMVVPVVYKCPNGGGVQVMLRSDVAGVGATWVATVGHSTKDPATVRRYELLVRQHLSVIIEHK